MYTYYENNNNEDIKDSISINENNIEFDNNMLTVDFASVDNQNNNTDEEI